MGAWGVGSLENDGGLDWLAEFGENGVSFATELLAAADESVADGHIEAGLGACVLALAEVLAASHGHPHPKSGDVVLKAATPYIDDLRDISDAKHRVLRAMDVLVAEADTSELYEDWEDAEELDNWLADVTSLKSRLEAA